MSVSEPLRVHSTLGREAQRCDGSSDFNALRSKRSAEAVLVAFDMLELHGEDLRGLSLHERKRRLKTLLGRGGKWRAIQYGDHLTGAGPTIFAHVCQMGLEGIVSNDSTVPIAPGRRGHG